MTPRLLHLLRSLVSPAALALALALALAGTRPAALAAEVPTGFTVETIATGLDSVTTLALLPDGRILIAEQTGLLRVWQSGAMRATPALDLRDRLDTWWERGLIGVTTHPDFPRTPHVFLLYLAKSPHTHHVLSRFTWNGETLDPASENILLTGDDQGVLGSKQPAGHQGGPLRFGPDGKLYVGLGEQSTGQPAQQIDRLQGKILRLNADGTIPADNPFFTVTRGKYRAIWAIGLRNPYGLAFQPETGRLFMTDVGQTAFEEVNEIVRGANYGWPEAEGMSAKPAYRNPLHAYAATIGRSVVGAAFLPRGPVAPAGDEPWPAEWRGKFFFADWKANWIKVLDPDAPQQVTTFARGLDGPVTLEFAPDGTLFVLNRATIWRDGKAWKPNTGSLVRIRHLGTLAPAPATTPLARTLADTALFTRFAPLTPRIDFAEVKLNATPWLPGVNARRWISLPVATRLRVGADGEFAFPVGTLVVQHHTVAKTGAPLETQVLRFVGADTHSRTVRAASYRWDAARTAAVLVAETALEPLPRDAARKWMFPAAEEALNLDAAIAGFGLAISPRQLDDAQLAQWVARGWLEPAAVGPSRLQLVALDDSKAPLELRVRSYLDANCAMCHRPGGLARSNFDARLATPLAHAGLFNAEPIGGDLGMPGAKVLVPGAPEKSVMVRRLIDNGPFRMPPLGLHSEPAPVVLLLEEWIRGLK